MTARTCCKENSWQRRWLWGDASCNGHEGTARAERSDHKPRIYLSPAAYPFLKLVCVPSVYWEEHQTTSGSKFDIDTEQSARKTHSQPGICLQNPYAEQALNREGTIPDQRQHWRATAQCWRLTHTYMCLRGRPKSGIGMGFC